MPSVRLFVCSLVLTIRFNPETQQRSLDTLQWGLIPDWAKDPKIAQERRSERAPFGLT